MLGLLAAEKSKMEQGAFWTKNNAYMFEDIMNDVLPMPRPPSAGEVMVYNSPRPSVLDSDEEDEEEVQTTLKLLKRIETRSTLRSLTAIRISGSKKDVILVGADGGCLSLLAFDTATPANIKKTGPSFDLAIAVGILLDQ